MEIEIVGRHALLFDDDSTAAFVNSQDALVEWNSLLIDRYDVRHLLSAPPPSRRRRNPQTSHSSNADAEIDHERYLDLPSPSDEQEADAKPESVGGFNAVPFSYGNYEASNDQKTAETESECPGFHPPFPVPDSLVHNVPPTEKVHQIIARTALFVSKNGGQSEIVLRVKQGDNPTFGFLMPDHHLHPYFRFLIDHQDLLQSKDNGQAENDDKTSNTENTTGALSLLGSVYGTGEDEDGGADHASSSKECVSDVTIPLAAGKTMLPAGKDEPISKHSLSSKEDAPILKRNSLTSALKSGRTSSTRKVESIGSLSAVPDKLRASSLPPIPKNENMLLDPPSDMKRLVDKIVEFIIKNGRQFEAVLMEQDRAHGRFPFLIPSNKFHPYYLKVLQKTQEVQLTKHFSPPDTNLLAQNSVGCSNFELAIYHHLDHITLKLTVKSLHNEKEDFRGHILNKKTSISRESESLMESDDIPLDSERKEKFKMVINKSKKEGSDLPSKATQPLGVQVDAAQAAAILQAATRGIKHPNLGILSSLNGNSYGPRSESGQPSNSAKDVASEADSSDAHLTQEQKLKAERLKRAKMFVAMLKSGAAPTKTEPSRGLSAEPQGSGASLGDDNHVAAKERERSMVPMDFDTSDKKIKSEKEHLDEERRAKRKYRARSSKDEEGEAAESQEEEEEEDGDEREGKRSSKHRSKKHRSRNRSVEEESEEGYENERDYKHSKRRHRSHRTSHKDDEERDHKRSRKKKHRSSSSYEDNDEQESEPERVHENTRTKHRSHHSSHDEDSHDEGESNIKHSRKTHSSRGEDEGREDRHRRRKHRSHKSSRHSRDKHKHRKSHSSRHKLTPEVSLDELSEHNKADKHGKRSNSEREELEEGEISSKLSGQSRGGPLADVASREPSVDVSSAYQDRRPVIHPSETTDVPDDLRAKIRAMLLSTM
ncbi:hypothetical protein OSB04_007753 [Centaurea solstitialis]|uniref:SURP motif domain-containing protein n=1 Tax=Centaurea solstitialis TaxID=347529 RepID=A0AA38TT08_9ASTR|nr:hypothetical protein OSB04_007753 [Centaurea solstitialis]